MHIILMRHGSTPGNLHKRYIGKTDESLTDKGRAEAVAAGVHPEVKKVYVSPAKRCRETAALCFPEAEQVVYEGLREMDFGDFENQSAAELSRNTAYQVWVDGYCEGICPNGENKDSLLHRAESAFIDLIKEAESQGEKQVFIVAHNGPMMAIMHLFTGRQGDYFDWHSPHAQGWHVELDRDEWRQHQLFHSYAKFKSLPLQ